MTKEELIELAQVGMGIHSPNQPEYIVCEALIKALAQRKPLSENEIKNLWYEACQTNLELTSQLIVHLARNIEKAHGIKETT